MTREQVEAMLAKLTRWNVVGDFEGGYTVAPCEAGEQGEFLQYDDAREMLEGMIDAPQAG